MADKEDQYSWALKHLLKEPTIKLSTEAHNIVKRLQKQENLDPEIECNELTRLHEMKNIPDSCRQAFHGRIAHLQAQFPYAKFSKTTSGKPSGNRKDQHHTDSQPVRPHAGRQANPKECPQQGFNTGDGTGVAPGPAEGSSNEELEQLRQNIEKLKAELKGVKKLADDRSKELEFKEEEADKNEKTRAALKKDNEDLRGMGNKLETEVNSCQFKMEEIQNANKTLQIKLDSSEQAVNDFKYKLDKSNKVCRANVDMYEAKLKSMEDHCAALTKEKDDLRDRFSKLAGHKLTDKNADIADLSDENRPLKISEKVGTLYDDEWTDAFQELTEKLKMQRQDTIKFLLDCLEDCFKICENVAEQQFDSLKNVILFPIQDTNFVPESKGRLGSKDEQALRDLRRKIGAKHGASVKQSFFMTLNKDKANEKRIPLVKPYLEKLADVCWLMAICDPPMYMDMTVKRGSKLDSNFYTPHTSSGKTVEYLVWPPLYNCKTGGGLISKGVVATERVVSKK